MTEKLFTGTLNKNQNKTKLFGSHMNIKNRVYSFKGNTTLYEKYMNAIFDDQFYRRYILKYLGTSSEIQICSNKHETGLV